MRSGAASTFDALGLSRVMRWGLAAAALGAAAAFSGAMALADLNLDVLKHSKPPDVVGTHASDPTNSNRIWLNQTQSEEAVKSGLWPRGVSSLLRVERQLRYGEYVWDETAVGPGQLWVRVDLQTQLISVFRGGDEIGTSVISYGADAKETPLGTFPIISKAKDHNSSVYDAQMPFTLRLTDDGVAIHGSEVRRGAATHGCVGVPLEFARLLFERAAKGDAVTIMRSRLKARLS